MKKIFTLVVCALMAFSANAQIQITKDGKEIKDGETIEFFAEEIELVPGSGYFLPECSPSEPYIINKGAATNVNILVEKADPKTDQLTWCMSMTGTCAPITGASSKFSGTFPAGHKEALDLHAGMFDLGIYKTYTAKVTVSANGKSTKFTIKFIYDKEHATGIESTHAANEVSVNNNVLSYNFGSNADRQLNVYGVSGRLVKSSELAQHGNISLAGLHRGVYIYEIVANGKRVAAHKFVVK